MGPEDREIYWLRDTNAMKIDLLQNFEGADGKTMADGDGPITLKSVLIQALTLGPCAESDKMKHYDLYRKLRKSPPVGVLKAEEIVTLKAAALKVCTVIVYGQVIEMLEAEYDDRT